MARVSDYPLIMAIAIMARGDLTPSIPLQQIKEDIANLEIETDFIHHFDELEKYFETTATILDVQTLYSRLKSRDWPLDEDQELVLAYAAGVDDPIN